MKHTVLVCGKLEGVQYRAAQLLASTLLDATGDYPACIRWADFSGMEPDKRYFFLGTAADNGYLREHGTVLNQPEGYALTVKNDMVTIQGADDGGVLYGCVDFYAVYLSQMELTHTCNVYFRDLFEGELPEGEWRSAPSVSRRGLWTWGHVIYDFRGYIDSMVRLKMNTVIIWNDFLPVNAAELVDYAHSCNVRVIWGYPWMWDTNCQAISLENLKEESRRIAAEFETTYAGAGDGIYFQSFTETPQEYIGDVLIAEAVTDFVNETGAKILSRHPELELEFGLHAESVREKLEYIRKVDPRIRIVWENCGAFPFSYLPEDIANMAQTQALARRITCLRGAQERTGVVLKGLVNLDWPTFHHQTGPYMMGVTSRQLVENRLEAKKKILHLVQAGWLVNGEHALDMVRLLRDGTRGEIVITALVEDGLLEKRLFYPVALLGEMLWNCDRPYREIAYQTALRQDVEFA